MAMGEKADNIVQRDVDIHVPVLARVEGEGALHLRMRQGKIELLHLQIYEPPRFFEKFLEGRSYEEVPDMVARICGICPVAYQVSAVNAIEDAFGIDPGPWVRDLRRVLYLGEWLESHALHIHLLGAPDFFGYPNAIAMAQDFPAEVRRGLKLQVLGNDIMGMVGARCVHPIGIKVGGLHHAPSRADVEAMLVRLHDALADAEALVRWTAQIEVPDDRQDILFVAMQHPTEYPVLRGHLVSSRGPTLSAREYEMHFAEHHVEHSTALYSLYHQHPYLVGPLARLNLNFDALPPETRRLASSVGVQWPSSNMFHSMLARAIEIHFAVHDMVRLLSRYHLPESPYVPVKPRAGTGYGWSEAPRGVLWHRYELDDAGHLLKAKIVPPTAQNQARLEEDLHQSLERFGLDRPDDELRLHCEKVIRNYDPCISCSTHFLRLHMERE
jgi:coenzyme F420-reducing hydrogenase alpha subunit